MAELAMTAAALLIYVALRGIFSEAKKPAEPELHEHVSEAEVSP